MFELMEFTAQLQEPTRQAIIPTFILPFTVLGMILTSLATWIAAFFGVKLKAEGPKKLFELLMKPKVLIWSVLANALFYGLYVGTVYIYHGPRPLWLIQLRNQSSKAVSVTKPSAEGQIKTQNADGPPSMVGKRQIKDIKIEWQTDIKAGVFGGVSRWHDQLLMGTDAGHLIQLDAKTGKVQRDFWIGQPVMTQPLVIGDKAYFGEGVHDTHHARYFKFDLPSGKINGVFPTEGHIERQATAAEISGSTNLLIPAGKDGLYAVNAETMKETWHAKVGHVDSFPLFNDKQVYVGTGIEYGFKDTTTKAYALNATTGEVNWERNLPTSAWGMPVIWKNFVCFSVGDVYENTRYGQIACYDQLSGDDGPAINLRGAVLAPPLLKGDHLLLSDLHGVVYQLGLNERKIDWHINLPFKKYNYAGLVFDDEDNLIMTSDDGINVYSLETQELVFHWSPPTPWKTPYANVLIFKDLWVLADGRGQVFALKPIY
jgi:hypothetical protein